MSPNLDNQDINEEFKDILNTEQSVSRSLKNLIGLQVKVEKHLCEILLGSKGVVNPLVKEEISQWVVFIQQRLQPEIIARFTKSRWENKYFKEIKTLLKQISHHHDIYDKIALLNSLGNNLRVNINIYRSMLLTNVVETVAEGFDSDKIEYIRQQKKFNLALYENIYNFIEQQILKYDLEYVTNLINRYINCGMHQVGMSILSLMSINENLKQLFKENDVEPYDSEYMEKVNQLFVYSKLHLGQLRSIQQLESQYQKHIEEALTKKQVKIQENSLNRIHDQLIEQRNHTNDLLVQNWFNAKTRAVEYLIGFMNDKHCLLELVAQSEQPDKDKVERVISVWQQYLLVFPEDLIRRRKYLRDLTVSLQRVEKINALKDNAETKKKISSYEEKIACKLRDVEATLSIDRAYHFNTELETTGIAKSQEAQFVKRIEYSLFESNNVHSDVDDVDQLAIFLEKVDWAKRSFTEQNLKKYVRYWFDNEKNLPFFTWLQKQGHGKTECGNLNIFGLEDDGSKIQFNMKNQMQFFPEIANGLLSFHASDSEGYTGVNFTDDRDMTLVYEPDSTFIIPATSEPYWLFGDDNLGLTPQGSFGVSHGDVRWISNRFQQYTDSPFEHFQVLLQLADEHQLDLSQMGLKLCIHYNSRELIESGYEQIYTFNNAQQVMEYITKNEQNYAELPYEQIPSSIKKLIQSVRPIEVVTNLWLFNTSFRDI